MKKDRQVDRGSSPAKKLDRFPEPTVAKGLKTNTRAHSRATLPTPMSGAKGEVLLIPPPPPPSWFLCFRARMCARDSGDAYVVSGPNPRKASAVLPYDRNSVFSGQVRISACIRPNQSILFRPFGHKSKIQRKREKYRCPAYCLSP